MCPCECARLDRQINIWLLTLDVRDLLPPDQHVSQVGSSCVAKLKLPMATRGLIKCLNESVTFYYFKGKYVCGENACPSSAATRSKQVCIETLWWSTGVKLATIATTT